MPTTIARTGPKTGYPTRMDSKDIQPGERYAVLRHLPSARGGVPPMQPVVHATVIERRGGFVICTIPDMVATVPQTSSITASMAERQYRPGRRTIRVAVADFICRSEDYVGKLRPDGRVDDDAERVTRAAGHTFTETRLAG